MGKAVPKAGGMKLLWENPSPNSSFGPQTITVANLNRYDVAVCIAFSSVQHNISTIFMTSGSGFDLLATLNYTPYYKRATINGNDIKFSETGSSTGTHNEWIIPYRIYGISF